MSEQFNVFNGTVDRYNGITIDTETEPIGDEFADKLKSMFVTFINSKCYIRNATYFWPLNSVPSTLAKGVNAYDMVQGEDSWC